MEELSEENSDQAGSTIFPKQKNFVQTLKRDLQATDISPRRISEHRKNSMINEVELGPIDKKEPIILASFLLPYTVERDKKSGELLI